TSPANQEAKPFRPRTSTATLEAKALRFEGRARSSVARDPGALEGARGEGLRLGVHSCHSHHVELAALGAPLRTEEHADLAAAARGDIERHEPIAGTGEIDLRNRAP